jgi:hypothetical protein
MATEQTTVPGSVGSTKRDAFTVLMQRGKKPKQGGSMGGSSFATAAASEQETLSSVTCPGCNSSVSAAGLEQHLDSECSSRGASADDASNTTHNGRLDGANDASNGKKSTRGPSHPAPTNAPTNAFEVMRRASAAAAMPEQMWLLFDGSSLRWGKLRVVLISHLGIEGCRGTSSTAS